jgi:hypothetical protein
MTSVDGAGNERTLSDDSCIQILDEAGLPHASGFGVVDLTQIPNESARFKGPLLHGGNRGYVDQCLRHIPTLLLLFHERVLPPDTE